MARFQGPGPDRDWTRSATFGPEDTGDGNTGQARGSPSVSKVHPAVIVVTHDQRALDVFDTIYEMEDGLLRTAGA